MDGNSVQTLSGPEERAVRGLDPSGIVFDTSSGISEEEQREILAGLDTLAGRPGIENPSLSVNREAKKRGVLFPLLVNIGALLLLAAGVLGLY
jgi:hypothetical protein